MTIWRIGRSMYGHNAPIPLYARVDGILSTQGDFLVLELELNEPGLYFTFAPEQAVHFAALIHTRLA